MTTPDDSSPLEYDFAIIGSGFGGSVSALRLTEKGYRVLLLEQGREFAPQDFPKTNWDLRRWVWAPLLGMRGFFQVRFFLHVQVMAGAGVGGGSLTYANTLPIPKRAFFRAPSWSHLADWESELAPHYRTVRRMLGARPTGFDTPADRILKRIAEERGTPEAYENPHVAVYMGEPGKTVPDPYFGGQGPERTGCILCGACMTGCRHGAKNTLDKNYLYLARKRGLTLHAETRVVHVAPLPGGDGPRGGAGYQITAKRGLGMLRRRTVHYRARRVIVSAGALGTNKLLLRLKQDSTGLPGLSEQLGRGVRTNSESLFVIAVPDDPEDHTRGIAINSLLQTDDHSHVEMVRFGRGSGFFRLLVGPHVKGAPGVLMVFRILRALCAHPLRFLRLLALRDWARSALVILYMRSTEGTLRFVRNALGLMGTRLDQGEPPRAQMPDASDVADLVARHAGGTALSAWFEPIFGTPTTAHILGGCPMGDSPETGVIDADHRVFGYRGLYVIDGAAVSANPGINPSLTIAALAERAMARIPDAGSE